MTDLMGNTATGQEDDVIDVGSLIDSLSDFAPDYSASNLVPEFLSHPEGRDALKRIVSDSIANFDADWESNSEYREKAAQIMALFNGFLPKKTFPWKDSANAHVPVLLENALLLHSRIAAEVFGDWTSISGAIGQGPWDDNESELVALHMNWQIREDIPNFKREMARALLQFINLGDFAIESFWDPEREQNQHITLTPDEFVTPFTFASTMPDYSDMPRYTRILRYYRHQVQAKEGEWVDIDKVLANEGMGWNDPDPRVAQETAEVMGQSIPTDISKDAPYVILQHYGWMELPGQPRDRWCRIVIDYATRRPLHFCTYEEADWRDLERFNEQAQELEQYRVMVQQHQMAMDQASLEASARVAQAAQGIEAHQALMEHKIPDAAAELVGPPPPPPDWVDPENPDEGPAPVKRKPLHMFTHGVCHESLTGSLGFGPGRPLSDYNKMANVAVSQFSDAATLSNAFGLIVADGVDFDRPFQWGPGKINKAKVSGAELKNAVMPLQPGEPSQALVQLMQLARDAGAKVAQAPEVLSGAPGKSGETYRGLAQRVSEATKQISTIGRSFADAIRNVLQNNAKLNSVFLPDDQFLRVVRGATATMDPTTMPPVTKDMYRKNFRIEIRSDLLFKGDEQRIAEADEILAMALKIPPLSQDGPFVYEAVKSSLVARHARTMIPLLGPPPPPTGAPFNMMMPPIPIPPGAPQPGQGQQGHPPAQPMGQNAPRPNNPQGPGGPAQGPPPPGANGAQA